jgi:CRISPR-associated protein Cmr1
MQRLTIESEIVTPLFLGGAVPRAAPELRAPSVRGALRYWLRAVLGAGAGLEQLKAAEANVFGDTSESSMVTVRVSSNACLLDFFERKQAPGRDGRPRQQFVHREANDTKYLFFSLDQNLPARKCFKPGERITIELIARRSDADAWLQACGSLWLLLRLGGLGARARRGAGGLQFTAPSAPASWPSQLPPLAVRANTGKKLADELAQDLRKIQAAMGKSTTFSTPTPFDILASGACRIWALEPANGKWQTWSMALKDVGLALSKARSLPSRGQLAEIEDAVASGAPLPAIDRAALGLPIVFQKKEGRRTETIGTLEATTIERRASPLHIRVVRLASQPASYAVVLTWFNAGFAPDDSELVLKRGDTPSAKGDLPDPAWMDTEFWPALFDAEWGMKHTEVKL